MGLGKLEFASNQAKYTVLLWECLETDKGQNTADFLRARV